MTGTPAFTIHHVASAADLADAIALFRAYAQSLPIDLAYQGFEAEMAAMEMFSPATMRANNVIGTPAEVVARLKRYEALGYDEYSFWIDTGMTFERKKRSLELFIEQVMPEFG